jgi:hypothetical protein
LHVHELFDQLVERFVIEIELALQAPKADSAFLPQKIASSPDSFYEAHTSSRVINPSLLPGGAEINAC